MPVPWVYSLFPKFLQKLSARELAEAVRGAGLDTTNLVIRDGYWVSRADMAESLPRFLSVMADAGLTVRFATAGFEPAELAADDRPLGLLAEHNITEFRMGYFKQQPGEGTRAAFDRARREVETIAALCERHGVRAVYQVHHGTLVPSASAAYLLVKGFDSRLIGVELDPGNQSFEGYEEWGRSASLLGEYLVAVGVKDSRIARDPARAHEPGKGWVRRWCPLDEGVTNWHAVMAALRAADASGTLVFMPFYHENDPAAHLATLRREVAYLRAVEAAIAASTGA
jgi:Sugar phosphate isomerases/epimerases